MSVPGADCIAGFGGFGALLEGASEGDSVGAVIAMLAGGMTAATTAAMMEMDEPYSLGLMDGGVFGSRCVVCVDIDIASCMWDIWP